MMSLLLTMAQLNGQMTGFFLDGLSLKCLETWGKNFSFAANFRFSLVQLCYVMLK